MEPWRGRRVELTDEESENINSIMSKVKPVVNEFKERKILIHKENR